jgi:hypothetical protein
MTWRIAQKGLFVVRKKRLRLRLALGPKHRAGAVKQAPAWLEQWPQDGQQARLHGCELGDIAFTAQPAHVGMAAHDARSCAGRVEQDSVETIAVPPCGRLGGVGRDDPGLQAEAPQRLVNTLATRRIDVQGRDLRVCKFQQVRRLAARRGASIEDA